MMTIAEARDNVGARVVYHPEGGRPERGVITGSSTLTMVFVRYDGDWASKATSPADLTLLDGES